MYEWRPSTLHAKTLVADGEWSAIGSMNFDNRSMALNDESALMVLDRAVGGEMDRIFMEDLQHADAMSLATFRQRSFFQRVIERGANLIMRVL